MKQTNTKWMIVAIYIATLVTAVESTIVVTATRSITNDLGNPELTALIFSTYLFSSALATPIFGHMADTCGKKQVFQFGLLLFLLGTTLCGISTSSWILLSARVIQGVGAGVIMPMTLALIGELFDLTTRGKIMGLNNSAWVIASLIAALVGGVILNKLTWHWIFLINIPFILFVLILVQIFYQEKMPVTGPKENVLLQFSYLVIGLLIVLSGIQLLTTQLFLGILNLAFGNFVLFLFYRKEMKAKNPILSVQTISSKNFRLLTICVFLINGALIGFQVYLPMWVQTELHLSPILAGFVLLPSSLFFILGSYYSGRLLARFKQKLLLQIAIGGAFLSFLCFSFLPNTTNYILLLGFSSWTGLFIGIGVTISVISSQIYAVQENLSTVSGFITLCRTLGQSFMVTILGAINQRIFITQGQHLSGYHGVYLTLSFIFIILWFLTSRAEK